MKYDNRSCVECNLGYMPKADNQKYCSQVCLKINYSKRGKLTPTVLKQCIKVECQKEFYVDSLKNPKKFCSSSCAASYNNILVPKRFKEGKCRECDAPCHKGSKNCLDHTGKLISVFNKNLSLAEKICINYNCSKEFSTVYASKHFCSDKCSNDMILSMSKYKISSVENFCRYCSNHKNVAAESCRECYNYHKHLIKIKSWLSGTWSGGGDRSLSKNIRNYLLEAACYECSVCGFNESHPDDGKTVLEINHIDGDGSNHRPENLEVLCPNHHALTSSYRGRNVGKGRKVYYLRVNKVATEE